MGYLMRGAWQIIWCSVWSCVFSGTLCGKMPKNLGEVALKCSADFTVQ